MWKIAKLFLGKVVAIAKQLTKCVCLPKQRQGVASNEWPPNGSKLEIAEVNFEKKMNFKNTIHPISTEINALKQKVPSRNVSDRLLGGVHNLYTFWAHFVVQNAYKIVFVCLVVTAICAFKMAKTKVRNNIAGFTPYGSRSLNEFAVQNEFFDQSGAGVRLLLLILPRDESDERGLLNVQALQETVEVDKLMQKNLTIFNKNTQRDEAYADFCHHFCTVSEPVHLFANAFKDQHEQWSKGEPVNPKIVLDYPFTTIYGQEVNLQPNFYGVHQSNGSSENFTSIDRIESIMIRYRVERLKGWDDEDVSNYELMVNNYFENNFTGSHIRVLSLSSSYIQKEIDRSGTILRRYVGLGVAVMVICSLLTNSMSAYFMQQFSIYRLPVAAFACFCPFMASATALGTLFFLGVRNASILGVTPFLILAIGIDDAFLTIHTWQIGMKKRHQKALLIVSAADQESIDDLLTKLLIEVFHNIGPAVLISALTNIFSDLVGMWTGSPEITLLCVGNIASIFVDFLYQITLFTAVLIICARWELKAELSQQQRRQKASIESGTILVTNGQVASECQNSNPKRMPNFVDIRTQFFRVADAYIRFVSNIFAALLICILSAMFLAICFRAILRFEINLTTRKLFPPDSPLVEVDNYREEKLLPFYTMAQIFINNPGDLSITTRRHHLDKFIEDMENLPYAYPAKSSIYYPRIYKASLYPDEVGQDGDDLLDEEIDESINHVDIFLNMTEYKQYEGLFKYHKDENGTTHLDAFMAIVAYHGPELMEWYERAMMLQQWRRVADKYPEFNISVLHDDGLFLDLLENMPTDIWQSALGTMICMAIICAFFMNFNPFVVAVTSAVIASILIQTLGIMALMGMTIDPVVMAAVIISMGFSVDIPAHVAYHYHAAKRAPKTEGVTERTTEKCIRAAFASVGFPAIQASTCTNICVLCLLVVPVYHAQVFVRVLCTCITLCTITSLCLLPALFTVLGAIESCCFRRSQ